MKRWTPLKSSERSKPSNHPLFSPTPDELRGLVLDYLCHNSYTETARAFVRDSAVKHLDADGDELMAPATSDGSAVDELAETLDEKLTPATIRRDIRVHILSGRVDEAIALLNSHFPSVLSEEREPLLGNGENTSRDSLYYVSSTSVDPTHLALNLHILAFIEAARTVPLPCPYPGTIRSHTHCSVSLSPIGGTAQPSGTNEMNAHQQKLLHLAQNLYAEAQSLVQPEDRATYLLELGQVSGLLAYTDPENSPVAIYLTQERREAAATQVDRAILYRTNKLPISRVELYTRYNTAVWSFCNEIGVKVPSPSLWPVGVKLPAEAIPSHKSQRDHRNRQEADSRKDEQPEASTVPIFNLSEFLDSKL